MHLHMLSVLYSLSVDSASVPLDSYCLHLWKCLLIEGHLRKKGALVLVYPEGGSLPLLSL